MNASDEAGLDASVSEEAQLDAVGPVDSLPDALADSEDHLPETDTLEAALPQRCVGSIPPAPLSPLATPLAVSPGELWRLHYTGVAGNGSHSVLVGQRIALCTGNRLLLLDRSGSEVFSYQDSGTMYGAQPVADSDGNIYWAASSVYSLTSDGVPRWKFPLGPNISPSLESITVNKLALSANGILFLAASDGFLYGLKAATGALLWRKKNGLDSTGMPRIGLRGAGDTLFVDGTPYDAATGQAFAKPVVGGVELNVWVMGYSGSLAGVYENVQDKILSNVHFLDFCLEPKWSFPFTNAVLTAYLLAPNNQIITTYYSYDVLKHFTVVYSTDGNTVVGPEEVNGSAAALGADGTLYNTECTKKPSEEARVYAYDPSLVQQWSVDLGPPCQYGSPNLAEDGVLYLTRPTSKDTELIAIQTTSPGLANSAFPVWENNNRRSAWLGSP